jgi:hypothetical protein
MLKESGLLIVIGVAIFIMILLFLFLSTNGTINAAIPEVNIISI